MARPLRMKLSKEQKAEIRENGLVLLPGLVPQARVRAARRAIESALARDPKYPSDAWLAFARTPPITDLYQKTPVKTLAESLIGEGRLEPVPQSELLLRFPQKEGVSAPAPFHIDGFEYKGGEGARDGERHSHTIAAAVFLSDTPDAQSGNLAVIPGSHRVLEKYFQEHPDGPPKPGMPDIPLGEPRCILAKAGDVLLYHYQVAHSGFAFKNLSPRTHYAAVFWAKHVDHAALRKRALADLWLEWPGIR